MIARSELCGLQLLIKGHNSNFGARKANRRFFFFVFLSLRFDFMTGSFASKVLGLFNIAGRNSVHTCLKPTVIQIFHVNDRFSSCMNTGCDP